MKAFMDNKICEHCGAKTVKYKHTVSNALIIGLYKLYQSGKAPINLKHLGLTRNQWDNFQKLRYWGLVEQARREDGTRISGEWAITDLGIRFIESGIGIKRSVWTYRGEPVEMEGDTCFFIDMHEKAYKKRPDYAEEALAH